MNSRALFVAAFVAAVGILGSTGGEMPRARADAVAYVVNVTVRTGYDFADADQALRYGESICSKVTEGRPYQQMVSEVKDDFSTSDEFQASYLISQAVNELCPALIWQLRYTAAQYHPAASTSS